MSMEEDLTRLVQATVRTEVENHMRTRSSEIIGRGGDVVLGGMGNIYLQPGVNKKAYYKGVEIGTGSGGTGISGSGTLNYIPRFTAASVIGDSHLVDDGSTITSSLDVKMSATATQYFADIKTGEIESKKATVETVDYYGTQITPFNYVGTNPGNIYIGDLNAAPAGVGIKIMDSRLDIVAVSGASIYLGVGTTQIASLGATELGFLKPFAMNSQKISGLAAGTTAGDAVRYEQVLLLTGGTMSGAIAMGTNKITGLGNPVDNQDAATKYYVDNNPSGDADTVDGYHASAFAILASNNTFTGNKQYLLGAGGSEAAYPQWLMQNTTYGAAYYSVLRLNDAGKLELKSAEGSIISMGSFGVTGSVTASTQLISSIATGTSPVSVSSTTMCTNLNADTVDGIHASSFISNPSTVDIGFSDGYGIDLRGDDVHKISYASGTNSLDIQSYQTINFKTTYDSGTPMSVAQDGVRLGETLFLRKNHAADNCYIVDDASGTMELHVPSGQKLKVVVG